MSRLINVLLCILIAIGCTIIYIGEFAHTLRVKEYTPCNFSFSAQYIHIEVDEAIDMANEMFGNPNYTLKFKPSDWGHNGCTNLITRTIWLKSDMTGWEVLRTLTHELVHFTDLTVNECYCNYKAFEIMYNSKNEIVHERGKMMAIEICSKKEFNGDKYDCGYYIKDYLKDYIV